MDRNDWGWQKYGDILHASRPNSEESRRKYPRMRLQDRAKIFAPFAALRGHGESLEEEELKLLYEQRRSLSEGEIDRISQTLGQLQKGDRVTIQYFCAAEEPEYGHYCTAAGQVSKVDEVNRMLYLQGLSVPFSDLAAVERG